MSVNVLKSAALAGTDDRLARFEAIYQAQSAHVRKTLFWLVPRQSVDDLVQDVFVKIWNKLDTFREASTAKTWIHRITINTAYDFLRSRKNESLKESIDGHPELEAPRDESDPALQSLIRRGLDRLPLKQRTVFVLFYKQELTIEEIAATLRVPKGTIKSRLFHARAAFTEFLSKYGVTI